MWIPAPLYAALPYAYVISGLLCIGGAAYIGIETLEASFYITAGILMILLGLVIFHWRAAYRRDGGHVPGAEPA